MLAYSPFLQCFYRVNSLIIWIAHRGEQYKPRRLWNVCVFPVFFFVFALLFLFLIGYTLRLILHIYNRQQIFIGSDILDVCK